MQYYATSSGLLSASAAIQAQGGYIHAITLIPAAAASTLTVYDNASAASGTVVAATTAVATGASTTVSFHWPVPANAGIYASVTGTGATFIIHYSLQ